MVVVIVASLLEDSQSSWSAAAEIAEASMALNTNFGVGGCRGIELNRALHRTNSGLSTTRYEVVRCFKGPQIEGCN